MERAERSGGLHKRSAEDWGSGLRARGAEPPCMSLVKDKAHELTDRLFDIIRAVVFVLKVLIGVGNRVAFSDSRSNFHTRVGYRTNVCRRRLASDLARASEGTPAQGAHEDHHDLPPGSPPEKDGYSVGSQVVIGAPHLLTDSPDEAGKFPNERSDDDGRLLATARSSFDSGCRAGVCAFHAMSRMFFGSRTRISAFSFAMRAG